eukprot:CAMPEP_0173316694 /NCGR_PEP_ID=MMETSP1143-20121109/26652_1 /TAXON_ID=483371 /ORGANISM="non described non described, Strain CCMP2298" /LENGTH=43 /DNA_ID= /DNA_START= /DNA_END= /DNA_ORIENTATION=
MTISFTSGTTGRGGLESASVAADDGTGTGGFATAVGTAEALLA